MKITKQRLKEIIKEEFSVLQESVESYDIEREEASNEGEADGKADALRGKYLKPDARLGPGGFFQKFYDRAYEAAAKKKYPSKRERSTHAVVSQADMDAAMATEQDTLKDLKRAVMIAYEIDRKITPENTELMREIDDIMSRHEIGFEEELEEAARRISFPVVSQADMDAAMGVTEPRLEPGTPEERAVVASSDKVKQHLKGEGVSLDSVSIKRYLEDLGLPPAIAGQYALWSAEKV